MCEFTPSSFSPMNVWRGQLRFPYMRRLSLFCRWLWTTTMVCCYTPLYAFLDRRWHLLFVLYCLFPLRMQVATRAAVTLTLEELDLDAACSQVRTRFVDSLKYQVSSVQKRLIISQVLDSLFAPHPVLLEWAHSVWLTQCAYSWANKYSMLLPLWSVSPESCGMIRTKEECGGTFRAHIVLCVSALTISYDVANASMCIFVVLFYKHARMAKITKRITESSDETPIFSIFGDIRHVSKLHARLHALIFFPFFGTHTRMVNITNRIKWWNTPSFPF